MKSASIRSATVFWNVNVKLVVAICFSITTLASIERVRSTDPLCPFGFKTTWARLLPTATFNKQNTANTARPVFLDISFPPANNTEIYFNNMQRNLIHRQYIDFTHMSILYEKKICLKREP